MFSSLYHSVDEVLALLGSYAAYVDIYLPPFRYSLLMTGCTESSENKYEHKLRNNPEEREPPPQLVKESASKTC
jgi:hypothetical protein